MSMEITNIIINVSISLIMGGGAGFYVFKWLGQKWISSWFDKDLEKFKQQLDLLKMQKQLQYNNIYLKQAEYIEEIYKRLANLDMAESLIKTAKFLNDESRKKSLNEYSQMIAECSIYSSIHGIYLTESIRTKLDTLLNTIAKDIYPQIPELQNLAQEDFVQRVKELPDHDTKAIMKDLRTEFEVILGLNQN